MNDDRLKNGISVVVVVKNEEDKIERCLESIKWTNEIIIVDNGSTDRTIELCRRYTDKIFFSASPFTGIKVNDGIKEASFEWILNIDADEVVNESLKKEILQKADTSTSSYNGYFLPIKHYFVDRWLRYGGWYPTYIKRFYKKNVSKYIVADHHVQIQIEGRVGYFNNPILHYGLMNIHSRINKLNFYTTNSSRVNFGKNKASWFDILLRPPLIFINRYFLLKGFLDGYPGFVIAVLGAFYAFIDKAKLKEMDYMK